MIPIEALRSKEGAAYLGGAALSFLVAVLLLVGGIERFLQEDALRAAVRAYHRDDTNARSLLLELKDSRPEDASVRVLLGCYEVERAAGDADRLGVAERLFQEARALDPSRASATLGVAVAQLELAAMQPKDRRAKEAAAVAEMLDRAGLDRGDPDYVATLAGAHLLRGQAEEALKLLSEEPREVPSRAGQVAWAWNEAMAAVLCRDGGALEPALTAYALRRLPMPIETTNDAETPPHDVARLLTTAYRVSLADPGAKPATTEALAQRAELARAAAAVRPPGGGAVKGRFLPPGKDEAAVLNAIGLGLGRLGRWEEAAPLFEQAGRAHPAEPLYMLNFAEGLRRWAAAIDEKDVRGRRAAFQRATDAYKRLLESISGKEGREETRVLAGTNAAVVALEAGDARGALTLYKHYAEALTPAAQAARDVGALQDHAKNHACVEAYRKAVSLNHPDSPAIEKRIRVRSRR